VWRLQGIKRRKKVLFYTDQEFKLEIILQNRRRIAPGVITPSRIIEI